jgi:hypothetical protein
MFCSSVKQNTASGGEWCTGLEVRSCRKAILLNFHNIFITVLRHFNDDDCDDNNMPLCYIVKGSFIVLQFYWFGGAPLARLGHLILAVTYLKACF